MRKKILIHTIVFSPDGVSTAYLFNDIALKFQSEGYEVVVITTIPQYNLVKSELAKQPLRSRYGGLYYESMYHNIRVKHVTQKKFKSTVLRLIGFIYWHIIAFFLGLREKNVDIILSPSPPITIGAINILLGKLKKAKVIYNVQEIYPDLLIKEKEMKSSFIIKQLKNLERFVYNKSEAVTTIDQIFYDTIIDRFKDKSKLKIIPNFVDTDLYKPLDTDNLDLDDKIFKKSTSLKLMYAGNIGFAQDWIPLIELAKSLKDEDIEFFVIGEGVMKEYIEKEITANQLDKLHILPYQPRNLIPAMIAYSDIQFIFMSPKTDQDGFPSKVYTIMACERPLMVCSSKNTPITNFLEDKNCAFLITENDFPTKIEKMANILKNTKKEDLRKMGKSGVDIVKAEYSKDVVTQQYVDLANFILN
ncbi:glycosyltransferase family 4 protein [Dysgonomonas sp. 520]|uniref:glycosyltransferase family 4 protein n=1 Tax=Dysgonomonas sp. 520 TaxID=2302931 RepID=UPI0013D247AB|nr:glycosyltransferase family 4 protein [Dysgonomonas sp. 520]NDW08954.1 glycosyltransferase WbuB [Dysgonomonas sp. 520]